MYGYIFWCKQLLTIKYVKTFQFTPESGITIIPKLNDLCFFLLHHKFKRKIRSSLTKNGLLIVRDITLLFWTTTQMSLSSLQTKSCQKGHSFITFWNVMVNRYYAFTLKPFYWSLKSKKIQSCEGYILQSKQKTAYSY